jgi:uncharacterized protein YkwD
MHEEISTQTLIALTNKERALNNLPTLKENPILDKAAELKAEDMIKTSYFAHNSPTGVSPWHWFDVAGYKFLDAGENLALRYSTSEDVVNAWIASPTHRANILNSRYTEIGMATVKGMYEGVETIYVVELFGNPQKPTVIAKRTTPLVKTIKKPVKPVAKTPTNLVYSR